MSESRSLRIAMLHPQMGIGGAERLTLNAAIGLGRLGHRPTIFTRELPAEHAFEEALDGAVDVRVLPTAIPISIAGRLKAPLAVARMTTLARAIQAEAGNFDVAYLNLVAHAAPALRRSLSLPVLYYCHYPDLLLTPKRNIAYNVYRRPIDALERAGLRSAAAVTVNSEYTAAMYRQVFPGLPAPRILYPGVALPAPAPDSGVGAEIVVLSINRFTTAKNLPLAVRTLAALRPLLPGALFARVRLVLAGGFDNSNADCFAALAAVEAQVRDAAMEKQVSIVRNPSEPERRRLLADCRCFLYTPKDEHFGLGPVEAMAAGKPVVACNSGGPAETIPDGEGGRLRDPRERDFAAAIAPWILDPKEAVAMGRAGREHVARHFSRDHFALGLEAILLELTQGPATR